MVEYPQRKQIRLKNYDYSQAGAYFVTICTRYRRNILSRIERQMPVGRGLLDAPEVQLTEIGQCIQKAITYLEEHDPAIEIAASVIMPNHIHVLLVIQPEAGGASRRPRPTEMRVPKFVSSLKRYTNRVCGRSLWQTSYHDHVIRDKNDFLTHWAYIGQNPARWAEDEYFMP